MIIEKFILFLRWLAITFFISLSNLRAMRGDDNCVDDDVEDHQVRPTKEATLRPMLWRDAICNKSKPYVSEVYRTSLPILVGMLSCALCYIGTITSYLLVVAIIYILFVVAPITFLYNNICYRQNHGPDMPARYFYLPDWRWLFLGLLLGPFLYVLETAFPRPLSLNMVFYYLRDYLWIN